MIYLKIARNIKVCIIITNGGDSMGGGQMVRTKKTTTKNTQKS